MSSMPPVFQHLTLSHIPHHPHTVCLNIDPAAWCTASNLTATPLTNLGEMLKKSLIDRIERRVIPTQFFFCTAFHSHLSFLHCSWQRLSCRSSIRTCGTCIDAAYDFIWIIHSVNLGTSEQAKIAFGVIGRNFTYVRTSVALTAGELRC